MDYLKGGAKIMDQDSQFNQKTEQFITTTRQDHDDMLKKLYANIPVAPEDPDYNNKVNNYLAKIGFKGIMELLGYDDLKMATLVMEGLKATKYNHFTNSYEADPKTRLSYIVFTERKIKEEKEERKDLNHNNITYIPPSWFDADAILAGPTHKEGLEDKVKNIKENYGQQFTNNNVTK